jgi:hypothetical protein
VKGTAKQVAEIVGCCPATVKRHLATSFNGGNNDHRKLRSLPQPLQPKDVSPVTPEDLSMAKAVRMLENVSGMDLTPWGLRQLAVASQQLARIEREHREGNVSQDAQPPCHAAPGQAFGTSAALSASEAVPPPRVPPNGHGARQPDESAQQQPFAS